MFEWESYFYWALLTENRVLSVEYRALLMEYRAFY